MANTTAPRSLSSIITYHGVIVLALTIFGQLLGFYREVIFGKYFGTTHAFDLFTITFSIISFVNSLLSVIPFFSIPNLSSAYLQKDDSIFSQQLSLIIILVFSAVLLFTLVAEIWANEIMLLIAPGLIEDQNSLNFAVFL